MGNARFPLTPAPPPAQELAAPSSSITSAPSTCPGCGQAVDPLRAGHVAVLEGRFRYFCRAECKQYFLRAERRPLEEDVATQRPPDVEAVPVPTTSRNGTNGHAASHARPKLPSAPTVAVPSVPPEQPVELAPLSRIT